jgi:hypothetical protein
VSDVCDDERPRRALPGLAVPRLCHRHGRVHAGRELHRRALFRQPGMAPLRCPRPQSAPPRRGTPQPVPAKARGATLRTELATVPARSPLRSDDRPCTCSRTGPGPLPGKPSTRQSPALTAAAGLTTTPPESARPRKSGTANGGGCQHNHTPHPRSTTSGSLTRDQHHGRLVDSCSEV